MDLMEAQAAKFYNVHLAPKDRKCFLSRIFIHLCHLCLVARHDKIFMEYFVSCMNFFCCSQLFSRLGDTSDKKSAQTFCFCFDMFLPQIFNLFKDEAKKDREACLVIEANSFWVHKGFLAILIQQTFPSTTAFYSFFVHFNELLQPKIQGSLHKNNNNSNKHTKRRKKWEIFL